MLQIHERVSPKAILKVAARQDIERSLFADPEQAYREAVRFYKYDIDWTNRLILGDSLQVMSSLARREDLKGKVQMIYVDPPYGISFRSNFQPLIGNRSVQDNERDLSREAEVVKAYRDTWSLGVHSYLSYLRSRLTAAKDLLADAGSIFVQISDENLHLVRALLDDVFGPQNFQRVITASKTSTASGDFLPIVADYLLWYSKNKETAKTKMIFAKKKIGGIGGTGLTHVQLRDGSCRPLTAEENSDDSAVPEGGKVFGTGDITSSKPPGSFLVTVQGKPYTPKHRYWSTNESGMRRLLGAERVAVSGDGLGYVRFQDDFPVYPISNVWTDTVGQNQFGGPKRFAVQTALRIVERCISMTTDPGDLVLDPTCGSGTTAYVAEEMGRRWITIDTSRVSIAIARQRLLTAKFDYYKTRAVTPEDQACNPNGTWLTDPTGQTQGPVTFRCDTVPHVTLKSIAQNTNLDPIFAKDEPMLEERLAVCNAALQRVPVETRRKLSVKLLEKQKAEGRKAITDADRRRWELPKSGEKWEHWLVPFDTDPDYPSDLGDAVTEYRKAWRAKMDEVSACITANAEQEELVNQPDPVKDVLRVSGPFTVEAVQPPEMSLGDVQIVDLSGCGTSTMPSDDAQFGGEPEELEGTFELRYVETRTDLEAKNVEAYLEQMIRLLRMDGVRFPNNKHMSFTRLEALKTSEPGLQAEGRWAPEGESDPDPEGKATVCVAFGPQYGPVTAKMVEDVIRSANRLGYDDLVIGGFSFDGPAQQTIEEARRPRLRIHQANIRPDINPGMKGLLKEQPGSQLFTVFGQPRTRVDGPDAEGQYTVTMEGVDIYNPVDNSITSTGADKVAAWFLDGDYDGRTFCITQAFFPDRTAWGKLSKALSDVIDPERFEALSGTESLPFPAGKHKCVAVKVIDPRGNEVMQVHKL